MKTLTKSPIDPLTQPRRGFWPYAGPREELVGMADPVRLGVATPSGGGGR